MSWGNDQHFFVVIAFNYVPLQNYCIKCFKVTQIQTALNILSKFYVTSAIVFEEIKIYFSIEIFESVC